MRLGCGDTEELGQCLKTLGNRKVQVFNFILFANKGTHPPVVFPHIVKVISPDGDCALHLHLLHYASQDAATDRHITSEGTFLVDVGPLNGL